MFVFFFFYFLIAIVDRKTKWFKETQCTEKKDLNFIVRILGNISWLFRHVFFYLFFSLVSLCQFRYRTWFYIHFYRYRYPLKCLNQDEVWGKAHRVIYYSSYSNLLLSFVEGNGKMECKCKSLQGPFIYFKRISVNFSCLKWFS